MLKLAMPLSCTKANEQVSLLFLVMKITTALLLFSALHVSAHSLSQTITLKVKDQPIKQIFEAIYDQTQFGVIYNDKRIDPNQKVTVEANQMPLDVFLEQVLLSRNLSYRIEDQTIFVKRRQDRAGYGSTVNSDAPIQNVISGRVTDNTGNPLQGVTVSLKGKLLKTNTDANGDYRMVVPDHSNVLIFSSIGYESQEISIGGRDVINAILQVSTSDLDEVVVIGYGTQKRKDITGSVASIGANDIAKANTTTFQEAIQGKLAGVRISASSGEPGSAMNISIRGANSIYASSSPLYVIDGVPYGASSGEMVTANVGNKTVSNPLAGLNPNDIESIDVLKDASATAIYGSRGASGVVIITTKQGKIGEPRLEYNGYIGVSNVTKRMNVLSADEYIDYMRLVQPNSSLFFRDTNKDGSFDELDEPRNLDSLVRHNFQDEIFRTGFAQDHNLSLSGNSAGTNYLLSANYNNQNAIIRNNDDNRFSFRSNISRDFGKRLQLALNFATTNTTFNGPSHSGGGAGLFNGVVQNAIIARPIEFHDPLWDRTGIYVSPLKMIDEAYKTMTFSQNTFNANAGYKLGTGLMLHINAGSIWSTSKGKEFYGKQTDWGVMDRGVATIQNSQSRSIYNTNQLNYEKYFTEKHYLSAMAAVEISQYDTEYFNVQRANFANEDTGVDDINKGTVAKGSTSSRDINRRLSYFARVNYNLLQRHLFTGTFRIDGSDKFGPGSRFGYFPSIAYAWLISEEGFLQESNVISNLKLRLSYGMTGNERISSFRYLPRLGNAFYEGQLGFAPSSRANPNLKWETTEQYNLGLDAALFKDRLSFTLDFYRKKTKDMLIEAFVPAKTGFSREWTNIGSIDNSGIELQVNLRNIDKPQYKWETNFNISRNVNKVVSIGNLDFIPVSVGGAWITDVGRVIVGSQIGTGYGYKFDGVYQIEDFTWQDNSDPAIPHDARTYQLKDGIVSVAGQDVKPGFYKFKDLNGDGIVDVDHDRAIISQSAPKFFGGINNSFSFKSVDLSVFLEGSYGNQIMNVSRFQLEGAYAYTWMNIDRDFYHNRWTPENPTNQYGAFNDINTNSRLTSDYYVEDASYLRLKNVSIGYALPTEVVKRLHVQGIRIYVSGNNLYTWTSYSGFDPEVHSGENLMPGLDRISYPRARFYNLGVNLTF